MYMTTSYMTVYYDFCWPKSLTYIRIFIHWKRSRICGHNINVCVDMELMIDLQLNYYPSFPTKFIEEMKYFEIDKFLNDFNFFFYRKFYFFLNYIN